MVLELQRQTPLVLAGVGCKLLRTRTSSGDGLLCVSAYPLLVHLPPLGVVVQVEDDVLVLEGTAPSGPSAHLLALALSGLLGQRL